MAKQKSMKLSKKRAGITIGIGIACATAAIAPMINQYLSEKTSASTGGFTKGICSLTEGTQILANDIITVSSAIEDFFFNMADIDARIYRELIYDAKTVDQGNTSNYIEHIQALINDDAIDWSLLNLAEVVDIAKASEEYSTNDELVNTVRYAEIYLDNGLGNKKITYYTDDISLSLVDSIIYLEPSTNITDDTSITERIRIIKSLPLYEHYVEVLNAMESSWQPIVDVCMDSQNGVRNVSEEEVYVLLRDEINAMQKIDPSFSVKLTIDSEEKLPIPGADNKGDEEDGPSTSTTPTTPTTPVKPNTDKLQSIIDQIKADPVYQKWYHLIKLIEEAEKILNSIKGTGIGAVEPRQMVDQPYITNAIQARTASIVLASKTTNQTQDLASIIKAIGNAMRDLGIETTLGQNLGDSVSQENLVVAINSAKGLDKYAEYAELVRILEEAEEAIKNGTADDKTLNNLTKALADTAKKLELDIKIPDTGILSLLSDGTATTTILATVATASILSLVVAIILYRNRKKHVA